MPKKFAAHQKAQWLEQYESGKSETWIANSAHCDVRTAKRGIEEARKDRDLRTARMELVKDALKKHQDGLLGMLRDILSSLDSPTIRSSDIPWGEEEIAKSAAVPDNLPLGLEGRTEWGLLREHMKHDPFWKLIAQRQKALAALYNSKASLQRKVVAILKVKVGYKLAGSTGIATPPCVYLYTTGPHLFDVAFRRASGAIDPRDFEEYVHADTTTGQVMFGGGTILAEARGEEEACVKKLHRALKALQKSQEALDVVAAQKELTQTTMKARQAVEEAVLLGMVPGRCRICRRLGM